jgi:hypothetical protein
VRNLLPPKKAETSENLKRERETIEYKISTKD